MIRELLEHPIAYEFSQFLWYRKGRQHEYVSRYVRPRTGEHVLDIGCGVGAVSQYFPDVVYRGFDSNRSYIEYARRKYGAKADFEFGQVGTDVEVEKGVYDLVMANSILHHLNDDELRHLLTLAYTALKSGGRLVTRDGCFEANQNPLARRLLEGDRGQFVRTEIGYRRLIEQVFPTITSTIRHDMMRVPYSLVIFECWKN